MVLDSEVSEVYFVTQIYVYLNLFISNLYIHSDYILGKQGKQ
jgi:hypothetical protein